QRDNRNRVNDDTNEMMWARTHAEQLAIEHVRQGRDWMPVGRVKMRERPNDVGETEPAGHAPGAIDVIVIVVTDPTEMDGLPEHDADQRRQAESDENFSATSHL